MGADEQAHWPFLAGKHMLDRGPHLGLSIVGAGAAPRHRLAPLAVDQRTQETVGGILRWPGSDRRCPPRPRCGVVLVD
jgi:hypothetical protein